MSATRLRWGGQQPAGSDHDSVTSATRCGAVVLSVSRALDPHQGGVRNRPLIVFGGGVDALRESLFVTPSGPSRPFKVSESASKGGPQCV